MYATNLNEEALQSTVPKCYNDMRDRYLITRSGSPVDRRRLLMQLHQQKKSTNSEKLAVSFETMMQFCYPMRFRISQACAT